MCWLYKIIQWYAIFIEFINIEFICRTFYQIQTGTVSVKALNDSFYNLKRFGEEQQQRWEA